MSKSVCIIIPPAYGLADPQTNIPLGPLYVAAVLEQAGHNVELVSLLGHDIPAKFPEADLYAMGFTTPQVGASIGILNLIRNQYPDAKVLAAGAHPTALPLETLALGFDSVLHGEAEITIQTVVADLPNMEKVYYGVPCNDLNSIPLPARHLLPYNDVHNSAAPVFRKNINAHIATIMTSRGCPGRCAFCSNERLKFRYRSAENIIAEMKQLVNAGVTCFKFQDDTFTLRKRHVQELGALAAKTFGPGEISVRIITRVDAFSSEIIPALRQLNTQVVSFGIESGSQKVLDLVHKGITIGEVERALGLARNSGFSIFGYMLFGLPGECKETVDETIAFLDRNKSNIDIAALSFFIPYPGCAIAKDPERYRMHILHRDWNRYWVVNKRSVTALPYGTTFDEMMRLRLRIIDAFKRLGYDRPEWENDL